MALLSRDSNWESKLQCLRNGAPGLASTSVDDNTHPPPAVWKPQGMRLKFYQQLLDKDRSSVVLETTIRLPLLK